MLTYTVGIRECLKKIFGGVLLGGLKEDNPIKNEKVALAKILIPRFRAMFVDNIFQNEYAVFYDIIANLNVKVFSLNQLQDIIDNNRDIILNSPYVDLTGYSYVADGRAATDDEKIEAFKKDLEDLLIELSNILVTEEEFMSACRIYIDWFKNQYMTQTIHNMALIMSDKGYTEKKRYNFVKTYKGVQDAQAYYNERIKVIRALEDEGDRIRQLVLDEKWLEEELEHEKPVDENAIFTFGIKEIDAIVGELRRGNLLTILGPPKGGKTRFTNYAVQRALQSGLNVAVWPVEGTKEEWQAMQIAAFIRMKYGISMNSTDILNKKYMSDEKRRKYVNAARLQIATNPEMGRLSFIEGTAYVEDFLDVLQAHYETENPFDIIVIDSLLNVMSKKNKPKVERLSEAFMMFKNFISVRMKKPALGIVPAQLKQSAVDYLRKNPEETMDVTFAGETSEVIRSADLSIGLFSSKAERAANIMRIYSVAGRHTKDFDDFMIRCDLQCCYFYSDETLN